MPALLDAFAVPRADLLAIVGLPALAAWGVHALARFARGRVPGFVAADVAVAAGCVAGAIAWRFGLSPRLSWLGELGQREGLRTLLALAGLWVAARAGQVDARTARRTRDVFLAAAVLAAVYALLQVANLDPIAWTHAQRYPAGAGSVLRPGSTLGNPNLLGVVLAAALAMATARLASGRGDPARLVPALALLGAALAATLSRGAMLAAAAGVLAALAGAAAARTRRNDRRLALALGAALLPAAAWSAFAMRAATVARLGEGAHAESGAARLEIARAAFALWRAHPWAGVGPDAFGLAFPSVQSPAFWRHEWLGLPAHAHSAALQTLATCGLIGVLAALAWAALVLRDAAARWHATADAHADVTETLAGLVALAVAGLVNPLGIAGATTMVVLGASLAGAERRAPRVPRPRFARSRAPLAAMGVALAVAASVAAGVPREWSALAEAARARAGLEALAESPRAAGLPLAAAADAAAQHASARLPGEDELTRLAADAALAHAEAAAATGDTALARDGARRAEAAGRRALALEPLRGTNAERVAAALAMRARLGERALEPDADAAYDAAERLAPTDGWLLVARARGELVARRWDAALATARRIQALYPEAASGHAMAAGALASLGRSDDALTEVRRALAAHWDDGSEAQHAAAESLARMLGERAPAAALSAPPSPRETPPSPRGR